MVSCSVTMGVEIGVMYLYRGKNGKNVETTNSLLGIMFGVQIEGKCHVPVTCSDSACVMLQAIRRTS